MTTRIIARNPNRDYKVKCNEYAQANIPEYWIIDPQKLLITVLELRSGRYRQHGEFLIGQEATSVLLTGFTISVEDVFAAG